MESWIIALIGTSLMAMLNISVVAYSYGSLTTKVATLEKTVSKLFEKFDLMSTEVAKIIAMEHILSEITDIVRKCPTCNQWKSY